MRLGRAQHFRTLVQHFKPAVNAGYVLTPNSGTFDATGSSVVLKRTYVLHATSGQSLAAITGSSVILTLSGSGGTGELFPSLRLPASFDSRPNTKPVNADAF